MTDLYKEAILEAKKLKEIAEEDAMKSIIDSISPFVKKAITKQISEANNPQQGPTDVSSFFLEQEEEPEPESNPAMAAPATPSVAAVPPTTDTAGQSLTASPASGDSSMSPPLSVGGSGEDIVNSSLDPQDGKITVNFEDLFLKASETPDEIVQASTAPITPAVAPSAPVDNPVTPDLTGPTSTTPTASTAPVSEPEVEDELETQQISEKSFNEWKNNLNELSMKVDEAFFSKNTPAVVKESLKMKLFKLLESLDSLKEKGKINSKQIKINENKLEFLFLKLKDGKLNNSYIENEQREDYNMTSLKEYAAKLFEETYADESDKELNPPTTASAKHAAKVSGVGPDVELKKESLAGDTSEKPWDEGEAELKEKDQDKVIEEALASIAEGSEGFGDTSEKPDVSFDDSFTEAELKEAVKHLRKESVKKKMAKLKEDSSESWEDGKPVDGKAPAQANLNKKNEPGQSLKQPTGPGIEVVAEELDLGLSDEEDDSGLEDDMDLDIESEDEDEGSFGMDLDNEDPDLVINIDLPDEVEAALADVDMSALDDITASLGDVNFGNSEESTESLDGTMETEEEEEMPVENTMPVKAPSMGMMQEANKRNKLLESKVIAASKALKENKAQIESLRSDLQEANLFIAKSVYFTKCLQRGDLSKANLTKIAEHLDRAKTVQETKEIYSKIKTKLAESVAASKKLVGSPSQVTTQGSTSTLNESVNHESDQGDVIASRRWQTLAGIKTPNDK